MSYPHIQARKRDLRREAIASLDARLDALITQTISARDTFEKELSAWHRTHEIIPRCGERLIREIASELEDWFNAVPHPLGPILITVQYERAVHGYTIAAKLD